MKPMMPAGRYTLCLPPQSKPKPLFTTVITDQPSDYVSRISWEFRAGVFFAAHLMFVVWDG